MRIFLLHLPFSVIWHYNCKSRLPAAHKPLVLLTFSKSNNFTSTIKIHVSGFELTHGFFYSDGMNCAEIASYCIIKIWRSEIKSVFLESWLDIFRINAILKIWKAGFTFKRRIVVKNRLEKIRKQRGIKQEDLASALEVSRQTIGSLENGRYNPSITLAFKIARYFRMSIEEIFIYEEES